MIRPPATFRFTWFRGVETTRDGFALGAMTCVVKAAGKQIAGSDLPARAANRFSRAKDAADRERLRTHAQGDLRRSWLLPIASSRTPPVKRKRCRLLSEKRVDGIVLDWAVSEVGGIEFIEDIQKRFDGSVPPMVILGSPRIDPERAAELHRLSRISAVRYAPSWSGCSMTWSCCCTAPRTVSRRGTREILAQVRQIDSHLAGRKVLIVDDDLRNIFALTSVLEQSE